jgi:glutamyl-tRNA synthetase
LLDSSLLDDKILIKSDGMPTYHFANVVDDKLMEISCVIRGEEWLPSLPIHKLIYDAFEWDTPMFMHLPLILKPSGKGKLSKRDGDKEGFPVFPISWGKSSLGFKESGFLTEGLINYLALLGWNSGTEQEVFSFEELKQNFSVDGIQKGGARFDFEKAKWINHKHIVRLSAEELISLPMVKVKLERVDSSKHLALIELIKKRLFTINDLQAEISWVSERYPYDEKVMQKLKPKGPDIILEGVSKILNECNELKNLKNLLMLWTKKKKINNGLMMQCFRFALIGKLTGPDLFGICNILGKNVSLNRVVNTISYFKQKN